MIKREITQVLLKLASQYPVVTITGPRQSGKTTLVKKVFKEKPYVNLENMEMRDFAQNDPVGFIKKYPDGAVIDEIQRVPELLSYIQVTVDESNTNNMFIITGSSQFELMESVTQSLAGRTAILKLLPFSFSEIIKYKKKYSTLDLLYTGFYPRIYDKNLNPTQALGDYFETYVERDIRNLSQIHNLSLFQKFVRMCAGRTGQMLNIFNLANDIGISHTTAREWISLLETSYIIFLLEPFWINIKKRLIKSPKLYFYDVGLASFLIGIENKSHIETHPLRGNLFENLVVMELLKYRYNKGMKNNLNFFRDSNHNEIDLIYNISENMIPIEIKAGATISKDYFKGFKQFNKIIPKTPLVQAIIYDGDRYDIQNGTQILNILNINKFLNKKL